MNYYLYLQTLFYDRPRLLHAIYSDTASINDVNDYVAHALLVFKNIESTH